MSKGQSLLRPDLQRMWDRMDAAPDKAILVDKYGDAWQKSAYLNTWYRAYNADGITSFELAQNADGARFVDPKPSNKREVEGGE